MEDAIRVLIVEDSEDDALLVERELRRAGFKPAVRRVETADGMAAALSESGWDVVIADYSLPEFSAPAALSMVKERGLDVPFIVVSGTVGEVTAVEMMRAGAQDYIMKDNMTRLAPAVERELRDAAERRRTGEELARERQLSGAIIDISAALIVMLDPQGRILRFNGACEKATGYAAAEVEGRPIWEVFIPREEEQAVRDVFGTLLTEMPSYTHENHWLTKQGRRRLISWANACVRNEDGTVRSVLVTGIDVTDLRELERRLQQAAKLEAVGQLAGGVAHDFNNLLTAILGYIDLNIPHVPKGTRLHDDLEQAKTAALRAADLTHQLLAFSRQQVAEPEVVDLNSVVHEMYKMLRHLIEERIEIKLVLADEPLRVMADRAQLGQVLLNLAINARDAMADGGLLTIETSRASVGKAALAGTSLAEGAYAKLRVTDTGTGMTREVRERVFEPFFTTKPLGHGTGLGLSTVYGIVKQHAGRIECDSEPGMGSTFRAYLPLVDADQGNAADTTGYDVKFGGDETVLLVEDEEAVRDLAARALKDFGYNVLCAGSGPEALELLSGHSGRLDLLITDLIMPRMDGRQLAQKVRMVRPRAKLLFMSGYGGSNLEIEVPGFTVLQKPFTAFRLAKRVRQVLDAR